MILTRFILCALASSIIFTVPVVHAYTITSFDPALVFSGTSASQVATLDAAVGIGGFIIEDFEDNVLIPGLTAETAGNGPSSNWLGSFYPDSLFPLSIWDGAQSGLVNVKSTLGDTIFRYASGTTSFGVGIGDIETDVRVFVNGNDLGLIRSLPNFNSSVDLSQQSKQVYIRIDSGTLDSPISEIRFAQIGALQGTDDSVTFDHLAVSSVPIPAAIWLFGSGLLSMFGVMRLKKT